MMMTMIMSSSLVKSHVLECQSILYTLVSLLVSLRANIFGFWILSGLLGIILTLDIKVRALDL